jgi:hypothetical protein
MKKVKFISLVAIATLSVGLSACGGGSSSSNSGKKQSDYQGGTYTLNTKKAENIKLPAPFWENGEEVSFYGILEGEGWNAGSSSLTLLKFPTL